MLKVVGTNFICQQIDQTKKSSYIDLHCCCTTLSTFRRLLRNVITVTFFIELKDW